MSVASSHLVASLMRRLTALSNFGAFEAMLSIFLCRQYPSLDLEVLKGGITIR
jgi:hypothetical protein